MSQISNFYLTGKISVHFTLPKELDKDSKESLLEDPGYTAAYSLEFGGTPDPKLALQELPLYPKFFQGHGSGAEKNGIIAVDFEGTFKAPCNPTEKSTDVFLQTMKTNGPVFLFSVRWGNTYLKLTDASGKITEHLSLNLQVSDKPPKGIKFPR